MDMPIDTTNSTAKNTSTTKYGGKRGTPGK
jgi:hypothetical protein